MYSSSSMGRDGDNRPQLQRERTYMHVRYGSVPRHGCQLLVVKLCFLLAAALKTLEDGIERSVQAIQLELHTAQLRNTKNDIRHKRPQHPVFVKTCSR